MSDEPGKPPEKPAPVLMTASDLARRGGLAAAKSKNQKAAARVNALKHGRYAKKLGPAEMRKAMLRRIDPEAPEILEAFRRLGEGDAEAHQALGLTALGDAEILRRAGVREIKKHGLIVKSTTVTADGRTIQTRKANPALDHVRRMHKVLGFTADDMQLTAKSRGQGAKDAAMTALLARMAMLRGATKGLMPGAAPIDVTPVP